MNAQAYGEQILLARRRLGLSQVQAAKRLGLSRAYLSLLELGKVPSPGYAVIVAVARALGVTPDDLPERRDAHV